MTQKFLRQHIPPMSDFNAWVMTDTTFESGFKRCAMDVKVLGQVIDCQ